MGRAASTAAAQEWRAHWTLVLSASLGMSMSAIALGSLGAFMGPLERAFHWPRAQISAGLTVYAVIGLVCAPFYGRLMDKLGPRRTGVPGVLLCGGAVALFGTATGSAVQWLILWTVYSFTAQIPKPITWTAGVSSQFEAGRGLALALTLIGGTVGSMVAPVLANYLIGIVGWRLAYAVMGVGWGLFAFILCYLFFFGRTDRDRTTAPALRGAPAAPLAGVSAREGLLSGRFFRIGVATVLSNALQVGMLVHTIPLLTGTGLTNDDATWLVGLAGIGGIAGTILCGMLVNRVPGHWLGAFFYVLPALPCAMLLTPSDSVIERAFPILVQSIAGGAKLHILAYLTTRYFGLRAYGAIFGVVTSLLALGVGVGPVAAGYIFDVTHSYNLFLIAAIPVSIVNGLLIFSLGRYPALPEPPAGAEARI